MRTNRLRLVPVVLALVMLGAACANHLKRGDRAAATGDWVAAEAEYRAALRKEPGDAGLKEKHANAKAEAMKQAKTRAERCLAENNFDCAQAQADYASSLDENDAQAHQLKIKARRARAMHQLDNAQAAIVTNPIHALDLVDFARGLSADAEIARRAGEIQAQAVQQAVQKAADLRRSAAHGGPEGGLQIDNAIELLTRAAKADPRIAQEIEAARAEKRAWIAAEYERLARLGDERLVAHDWANAIARYEEAERFQAGGRAAGAARYAKLVMDGDAAVARKDWKAATDLYHQARSLPEDGRDRYAAAQWDRVLLKPYRIKLVSILVDPARPTGGPWVGTASSAFRTSAPRVFDGRIPNTREIRRVPAQNIPSFHLEITLPDGRRAKTPSQRAILANLGSSLVVESNAFEQRTIGVRVFLEPGAGKPPEEMDVIQVPVSALLAGQTIPPPAPTLLRLETRVERAVGQSEGVLAGLELVPEPATAAAAP